MGRIRTIKPEFFQDDEIASLEPRTRLLFIGLWTLADREGRLEDRPARIQATLFPYEPEHSVEPMLSELAKTGFIARYNADGRGYIEIRSFVRHQRPHPKEGASRCPPPGEGRVFSRPSRGKVSEHPVESRVVSRGEGKESWEGESTREGVSLLPVPGSSAAPAVPMRAARRAPPGFALSAEMATFGATLGLSEAEIAGEHATLCDHTFATARSDWAATERNWLRKAAERRTRGSPAHMGASERTVAAVRQLIHETQAAEVPDE